MYAGIHTWVSVVRGGGEHGSPGSAVPVRECCSPKEKKGSRRFSSSLVRLSPHLHLGLWQHKNQLWFAGDYGLCSQTAEKRGQIWSEIS